jgi:hypothetical protein
VLKELAKDRIPIIRQVGPSYEFRHDQMRAFLAALWLVDEAPTLSTLEKALVDAAVFALNRRDQEELWRFLVALLKTDEEFDSLWLFAHSEPVDRALLVSAIQAEADKRNITLVRVARQGQENKSFL